MSMITFARKLFIGKVQKLSIWEKICFPLALLFSANSIGDETKIIGFVSAAWIYGVYLGVTMESIHAKMLYMVPKLDGVTGKIFYWYNFWKSSFVLLAFSIVTIAVGELKGQRIGDADFWICVLGSNIAVHMYLIFKDLPLDLIPSNKETLENIKTISGVLLIGIIILQCIATKQKIIIVCLLLLVEGLTRTYRRMAAREITLLDYDEI